MASNKHTRNLFLNEIGAAVGHLRLALNLAEEKGWDDFYGIEDQINDLITLSNLASQLVQD